MMPDVKSNKPWLNSEGRTFADDQLKIVSKDFSPADWENYLGTLESPQRECRASQVEIESLESAQEYCATRRESAQLDLTFAVQVMLQKLTPRQKVVIEKIFFFHQSERQVAGILSISRQGVCDLKFRALRKLMKIAPKVLAESTYSKGIGRISGSSLEEK